MSPLRAGLRSGLAGSSAALLVGVLGFPQPFLAVIASQLVVGQEGANWRKAGGNLGALVSGVILGSAVLAGLAQQPWLLVPVGAWVAGLVGWWWFRQSGQVAALFFLMGMVATLGTGLIYPGGALVVGFAHAGSLLIAWGTAAVARGICGGGAQSSQVDADRSGVGPGVEFGLATGLAVLAGFVAAGLFFPGEVVPLSIAVVTTCCGLASWPGQRIIFQKMQGAVGGGVISVVFLIVMAGAGNDLAVFLGGLGLVLGVLEMLAVWRPQSAALFRQSAAVFAVAATMLPAPLLVLDGVLLRIGAVWVGFLLALGMGVIFLRKCSQRQGGSE